MAPLGTTGLDIYPLCLGGNVFGWTADREQSFAVLDAFAAAGGNLIDTADAYSAWAPGNSGGESETILGEWMAARGNRDTIHIATKVAKLPARPGLSAANIHAAVDDSLRRLRTDHLDIYYAHHDDQTVPLAETLGAFDELVRAGKVRHLGASQYTAPRLGEALAISDREGLARYEVVQPQYNLMDRTVYEGDLADLCVREKLAVLPYYGLAMGFLTGKYRPGTTDPTDASPRAAGARRYLDARGLQVLSTLDEVAAIHSVPVATVALAWLRAQPAIAAPIASARTPHQLSALLASADLTLTPTEVTRLNAASQ
ncbi:aldo/keto reductase [Nocardia yunnanensis]|uniref:Aldo/keto reductase n=1 Tax=Nocardia yunnanensis TaxID=2382165 RepID=A0A386ZKE4_9NOCA|nr:aldo/keto reductase [Nocardia yunnanensis]AYF77753.1 aldo/keto reductase [Nocardia yunnanensis]